MTPVIWSKLFPVKIISGITQVSHVSSTCAERQHTRGVLLILGSNEILLDKMQEKLNDMMRRDDELDKDEAMKSVKLENLVKSNRKLTKSLVMWK